MKFSLRNCEVIFPPILWIRNFRPPWGHRASDRHNLRFELMEKTLCRIFHGHRMRRLGFRTRLCFMMLDKSFKVSRPQFPPSTNEIPRSALCISKIIENAFILSAELWRDCISCWNTVQIKHSACPTGNLGLAGGTRQVNKQWQCRVMMAAVPVRQTSWSTESMSHLSKPW